MNAQEVIKTTQSLGISLTINQDRLVIKSPRGRLSENLTSELKQHKREIISLLGINQPSTNKPNIYRVVVDDKSMTVIDPSRQNLESFTQSMYYRFGKERVMSIQSK